MYACFTEKEALDMPALFYGPKLIDPKQCAVGND